MCFNLIFPHDSHKHLSRKENRPEFFFRRRRLFFYLSFTTFFRFRFSVMLHEQSVCVRVKNVHSCLLAWICYITVSILLKLCRFLFSETLSELFLIFLLFSISCTVLLSVSSLLRYNSSPFNKQKIYVISEKLTVCSWRDRDSQPRHEDRLTAHSKIRMGKLCYHSITGHTIVLKLIAKDLLIRKRQNIY